jgi:hypothetical protein
MGRARCSSDVAVVKDGIPPPSWRSRIPARREGVPEANGVFSFLIGESCGLRERHRLGEGGSEATLPGLH